MNKPRILLVEDDSIVRMDLESCLAEIGFEVAASCSTGEAALEVAARTKPDLVLMDMWAKLDRPDAVFYDITWVGFCGAEPPAQVERVFTVVRDARDRAIARVKDAVRQKRELQGFEVDDAAREYVRSQGFEEYFFHRTGHSIGTEVHGSGANMDNLETHDERRVIPWTCFSVEPGIYLPEFGIRLEVDVFVGDREARVTGEVQDKLVLI